MKESGTTPICAWSDFQSGFATLGSEIAAYREQVLSLEREG